MIDPRIFYTIYALCAVGWVALFLCILVGVGPGKPHHKEWKKFINTMATLISVIGIVTFAVQILQWIWS